jgi:hypothetical protein
MQDVKDLIEQMEPAPDVRGDWDAVMRDAGARRRPTFLRPITGVAVAAAAIFALALAQPWDGDRPTFLERALAAVDDGPVLHVVLRGEWGGTLVDLETGSRAPVYGENEIWYDFERGLMHAAIKLGGVVEHEEITEPREPPPDVAALGRQYRQALETGSARIAGDDTLAGEPVTWVTIRSEDLPDVADGKLHRWAEEIAISRETYKPVALRQTRDGVRGPGTLQRVIDLEMLPADQGDFSASETLSLDGTVFFEGRAGIALEQAAGALGRTPLWLGPEHRGLGLTASFRTTRKTGRQARIEVTGAAAQEAKRCSELEGEERGECIRAIGRHPLEVRPEGVFTRGATVWDDEETGLQLFYGTVGDEPSTYRKEDDVPLLDRPHVAITETIHRSPIRRGVSRYVPPEGSVFVQAGRQRLGLLQVSGVYVAIDASSEELMLSAARSLEPMTG